MEALLTETSSLLSPSASDAQSVVTTQSSNRLRNLRNILAVVAKRFRSAEVLLTTRSSNRLWDLTLELQDEARGIYDTSFPSFIKRDRGWFLLRVAMLSC